MPYKDKEQQNERKRQRYAELRSQGISRTYKKFSAICPVCSGIRELTDYHNGLGKLQRNADGHIIKRCRSCSKRKDYAKWYDNNFIRQEHNKKLRELKVKCIEYLGGKCQDCGLIYNGSNPYAFDFHHRNPEEKKFLPASKLFSWEKCKSELDKCDLLCAICHRKLHFEEVEHEQR